MTAITSKRLEEIEAYQAEQRRLKGSASTAEQRNALTPEQTTLVAKIRNSAWKEYLQEPRWCAWFQGDPKPDGDGFAKVPLGSHSDPKTWCTFDELCAKLKPGQGIGYNFLGGDLHPLDLDHVRNPQTGMLCNEAMVLLSRLQTFSEVSISGRGLHVLFKGNVRGHQLTETMVQYWNPAKAPRFFTVTADVVGEAFSTIKDVGEEFNYIFATARHISAKCREELATIDPEQYTKLPVERAPVESATREKAKHKTRKVAKDFDIYDFLKFYKLEIDNETDNALGHCIRLTSCPIKGDKHVGQNGTSTNFIFPTKDGGLAFHCQSTGCVEKTVHDVIKQLAEDHGPYPKSIYVEQAARQEAEIDLDLRPASRRTKKHTTWLWPGYLTLNALIHGAGWSGQGKSPATLSLASIVTRGDRWPDGAENTHGPRSVVLLTSEDDWDSVILPRLELYGANLDLILEAQSVYRKGEQSTDLLTSLNRDIANLSKKIEERGDVSLVIIDPITNYLEGLSMNKEQEMRGILMPLANMAQRLNVCVLTIGHLNRRGKDAATLFDQVMGAAAFVGVARQTLFFTPDPDDENEFAHIMGLGRKTTTPAMKYRTKSTPVTWDGKTSDVISVDWTGKSDADMEEAAQPAKKAEKSITGKAVLFVSGLLRTGAKKKAEIDQALKENGFKIEALDFTTIKKRCKAESRQIKGQGKNAGWEWFLPTPKQAAFDVDPSVEPVGNEQGAAV